jgi:hypothetical protein
VGGGRDTVPGSCSIVVVVLLLCCRVAWGTWCTWFLNLGEGKSGRIPATSLQQVVDQSVQEWSKALALARHDHSPRLRRLLEKEQKLDPPRASLPSSVYAIARGLVAAYGNSSTTAVGLASATNPLVMVDCTMLRPSLK